MPKRSESHTETFTKLFAEYRGALHRYIRRFVESNETTKEIVQEAFLRTYRQFDSVKTFKAFLFSTARNLAVNEYHHRQVVETDRQRQFGDLATQAEGQSPEAELLKDEWNRLILEAVDRLSPQCRAALVLRVFHQCSYKEVANQLGISPKTAEKHIARGLRETHAYLDRRYNTKRRDHG